MVKTFRKFLAEKLIDIDAGDINKIYAPLAPYTKLVATAFKQKEITDPLSRIADELNKNTSSGTPLKVFNSSELKSVAARQAHSINPITISVYTSSLNYYNPLRSFMNIGFNDTAVRAISMIRFIEDRQIGQLKSEFTEIKVKSTIRHELVHWIDDSLHNLHMQNAIKKGNDYFQSYVKAGNKDVSMGHIEITGSVNQIAEIKRRIGPKKYDSISFEKMLSYSASLIHLNNTYGIEWRKKLIPRLAREGLIGKSMKF